MGGGGGVGRNPVAWARGEGPSPGWGRSRCSGGIIATPTGPLIFYLGPRACPMDGHATPKRPPLEDRGPTERAGQWGGPGGRGRGRGPHWRRRRRGSWRTPPPPGGGEGGYWSGGHPGPGNLSGRLRGRGQTRPALRRGRGVSMYRGTCKVSNGWYTPLGPYGARWGVRQAPTGPLVLPPPPTHTSAAPHTRRGRRSGGRRWTASRTGSSPAGHMGDGVGGGGLPPPQRGP